MTRRIHLGLTSVNECAGAGAGDVPTNLPYMQCIHQCFLFATDLHFHSGCPREMSASRAPNYVNDGDNEGPRSLGKAQNISFPRVVLLRSG